MLSLVDSDGKILGHDAVKFFQRSHLPQQILAKVDPRSAFVPGISTADILQIPVCLQVWTLADTNRQGYLDEKAFAKVRPALRTYVHCIPCDLSMVYCTSFRPTFARFIPSTHKLICAVGARQWS